MVVFSLFLLLGLMVGIAQAQTGQIFGWVHKSPTEFISDVHVVAYYASSQNQAGDCFTDGVGYYSISLPPGTYNLAFFPPAGPPYYLEQWFNNKLGQAQWAADPITLAENSTIEISPTLIKGGFIEGRVTSDGFTGIKSIMIQIFTKDYLGYPIFGGWTDDDGRFRTMVPGGGSSPLQYYAIFNPFSDPPNGISYLPQAYDGFLWNYGMIPNPTPTYFDVFADTVKSNINAQLQLGGIITGTVYDRETNLPIPYMCVSGGPNGQWMYQARTGSEYYPIEPGRYYLTILPGEDIQINAFDCSGSIGPAPDSYYLGDVKILDSPVVAGQTYTPDQNFYLDKGGKISGYVRDAENDAPVPNACVNVEDLQGNFITGLGSELTDPTGFYRVPVNLQPGSNYRLRVNQCNASSDYSFPEYYNGTVTVVKGITMGYDIGLKKAGTISATIRNTAGRGILNVSVLAINSSTGAFVNGGWTDGDGKTSFKVPVGSYRIDYKTYDSEGYYLSRSFDNGNPIFVSEGATTSFSDMITTGSQLSVDIKPGINPNLIRSCESTLSIGILSTNDLKATKINPDTLNLLGVQPSSAIFQDLNGDNRQDLLLTFSMLALNLAPASSSIALSLNTTIEDRVGYPLIPVAGSDYVFVYDTQIPPTVFEDFSLGFIDNTKWSLVTPIQSPPPIVSDGKLIIESSVENFTSTRASGLFFKNSTEINNYKAKVKIIDFNNPNGGWVSAQLGGFFYNDTYSTPNYASGEGNIFALVSIGVNGPETTLEARWRIVRTENANYTLFRVLDQGVFEGINLNIGEEYTLLIGWNGSEFTFSVDGVEIRKAVSENIYPASTIPKYVRTYLSPPSPGATYSAYIKASFDDIEIPAMANYTPSCTTEPVQVQPLDTSTGLNPVTVTYDQITQCGVTTLSTSLSTSSDGPEPPSGFQLGDPPTFYEISTTATFTGPIDVAFHYAGVLYENESSLRLLHWENGEWINCTTSVDMVNKIIYGTVYSLSPFVIVELANQPPVFATITNQMVYEGESLVFNVSATDPEGGLVTLSGGSMPAGASFDETSGLFSWTPQFGQGGNYQVTFTAADNGVPLQMASTAVTITVNHVNRPPVLSPIDDKTIAENETLSFVVYASDPDPEDTLTYSADNLPPGAQFDPTTRTFTWIPSYDQGGTYPNIEFSVVDNGTPSIEVASQLINITVSNFNRPPVFIPIGTKDVLEGQLLQFYVSANDLDDNGITYSTGPLPPNTDFDPAAQLFTWTPDYSQAGIHTIVFYAQDNDPLDPKRGQMEVVISVGEVTALDLANRIIDTVTSLELPKQVTNSCLANLKKVPIFIQSNKVTPAINQLNAFVSKVEHDMEIGKIGTMDGNNLIKMASDLIAMLNH